MVRIDRRPYIVRVGDVASQALNTILLNGSTDESISGRAYRMAVLHGSRRWRYAYRAINTLFFWQDNHCRRAYELDLERARKRLRQANVTV